MAVPSQLRFLRPRRQRPFLGTAGGPYIQALEVFAALHWALSIYVAFILCPKALPDVIMPTLVLAAFWSPGPGSLAFVIAACVSRGLHALWITWGLRALLTASREPLHFRLLPIICALAGAILLATALLLWERRRLFAPPGLPAQRWRIAAGILVALATLKLSWVGPLLRLTVYGELR